MTYAEKRQLVEVVFGGSMPMVTRREAEAARKRRDKPVPKERRMGVSIGWVAGQENERHKVFDYYIRGHLIAEEYQAPLLDAEKDFLAEHYDMGEPPLQKEYLGEHNGTEEPPVKSESTKSASY